MRTRSLRSITTSTLAVILTFAVLPLAVIAEPMDLRSGRLPKFDVVADANRSHVRDSATPLPEDSKTRIRVDKAGIFFNEANKKKGELINIDNVSGDELILDLEFPPKGLLYPQVIRKPDLVEVPGEQWNHVSVQRNAGISIVILPVVDPDQIATLDGEKILIHVYQANQLRETRRIPVGVSSELKLRQPIQSLGTDSEIARTLTRSADLMEASKNNSISRVEELLAHGAEAKATDANGRTALMHACSGGHVEIAKLLIERGAETNAKDKYGWTALERASEAGHLNIVSLLLAHGASINATDSRGATALMKAAWMKRTDVVKLLLDRGADVDMVDNDGGTALTYAAASGSLDLVKLLLARGASPQENSKYGGMALISAASHGHSNVVRMLLDRGADANARDKYGWTALTVAARMGHVEPVRVLLEKGVDMNSTDSNGRTALMCASWGGRQGQFSVVKLLLDKGANINIKDAKGRTALQYALLRKHEEIVELLKKHSARE